MAALHVVATPYAVAGSYTTLLDTTPNEPWTQQRLDPRELLRPPCNLGHTDIVAHPPDKILSGVWSQADTPQPTYQNPAVVLGRA